MKNIALCAVIIAIVSTISPIAQAAIPLNTIGVTATIGFIDSSGGSSCSAGLSISEQSQLNFGSFASTSNGIFVVNPGDGDSVTLSGSPQPGSNPPPTRGLFLITQLSPEENCDVEVDSPSNGDPTSCYPSQTMINGSDMIPFRVILSPANGTTAIPPGGSATWYSGGAIQTSCSPSAGNFSTGAYNGTYTVNVDYI